MNSNLLLLFRLTHVIGGVVWVGSVFLLARFVFPAVRAAGPGGGAVMEQLGNVLKLPRYLTITAVLTILSGIGLYANSSLGFQVPWMRSGPGLAFGLGGLLGIITAVLGATVNAPLAGRIAGLARTLGPDSTPEQRAELDRLRARLDRMGQLALVMLLVATAAMAVARYL